MYPALVVNSAVFNAFQFTQAIPGHMFLGPYAVVLMQGVLQTGPGLAFGPVIVRSLMESVASAALMGLLIGVAALIQSVISIIAFGLAADSHASDEAGSADSISRALVDIKAIKMVEGISESDSDTSAKTGGTGTSGKTGDTDTTDSKTGHTDTSGKIAEVLEGWGQEAQCPDAKAAPKP